MGNIILRSNRDPSADRRIIPDDLARHFGGRSYEVKRFLMKNLVKPRFSYSDFFQ